MFIIKWDVYQFIVHCLIFLRALGSSEEYSDKPIAKKYFFSNLLSCTFGFLKSEALINIVYIDVPTFW